MTDNKLYDRNSIREFSNYINKYINNIKGAYYVTLHTLLIICCSFVLLFSTNSYHLTMLLIIISLDSLSIVFLHDCPLTRLEEKYLGASGKEKLNNMYKNAGIVYKCDHLYESQLELLINIWALTSLKIVFIIIMSSYSIRKI